MDPRILDAAGWAEIGAIINKLVVFTVLVILGAFAALLERAVLPSLIATHAVAPEYSLHRRILAATAVVAFGLAIVEFIRIVGATVAILQAFYPRFGF